MVVPGPHTPPFHVESGLFTLPSIRLDWICACLCALSARMSVDERKGASGRGGLSWNALRILVWRAKRSGICRTASHRSSTLPHAGRTSPSASSLILLLSFIYQVKETVYISRKLSRTEPSGNFAHTAAEPEFFLEDLREMVRFWKSAWMKKASSRTVLHGGAWVSGRETRTCRILSVRSRLSISGCALLCCHPYSNRYMSKR